MSRNWKLCIKWSCFSKCSWWRCRCFLVNTRCTGSKIIFPGIFALLDALVNGLVLMICIIKSTYPSFFTLNSLYPEWVQIGPCWLKWHLVECHNAYFISWQRKAAANKRLFNKYDLLVAKCAAAVVIIYAGIIRRGVPKATLQCKPHVCCKIFVCISILKKTKRNFFLLPIYNKRNLVCRAIIA